MTRNSGDVRNSIIETSAKYFARFGLYKTTIDEIAQSLRMGKSSLYYYFRNKEDIFKAVIQKEVEVLSTRIRQQLAECATPRAKLKVFSVTRMLFLKELTNIYSALRDDYLAQYAFIQELRKDYDLSETKLMASILTEGVKNGEFVVSDIGLTSKTIITALKGLEYEWAMKGDQVNIEQNIDKLLEILLYGIAPDKRQQRRFSGNNKAKKNRQKCLNPAPACGRNYP